MSKKKGRIDQNAERRDYFRIVDTISLKYQPVAADSLDQKLERLESGQDTDFTVMSSLALVTQEMAGVLRKIETRSPDVARYLSALDRKIDLLGRALLAQASDLSEQPARPVNISASGMSFFSADPLAVGSMLELKLLLLPSFAGVLTYSEVVSCEQKDPRSENAGYRVRVNFTHLREADKDVLIKHVLHRQGEILRLRLDEKEA